MIKLDKHPYDWIIHFLLCFVAIYFRQATLLATIFVAVMLEYEQWKYSRLWYSWSDFHNHWEYFYHNCLGDLIADALGIVLGVLCR